jgi:hypothetical protein
VCPLLLQVLEAAVPAVVQALPRFSVQMLADMLCSYAELGITNDSLLTTAAQVGTGRVHAVQYLETQCDLGLLR